MVPVTTSRRGLRFPILQGILPLSRAQIPADLIAGLTLAALAIPEVMGYTKIAGTPVITGLYTLLIPMTLYALFGASRHLVVGADSATAAIIASSIAALAVPYSGEWLALAGLLALMSAVFMYYANAHVFIEEVMTLVRGTSSPLNWFCIDAAAVDDVDFTAAAALRDLHASLADQGIRLVFSQLTDDVRAEFDRSDLTSLVGADAFFPELDAVLSAFEARPSSGVAPGA